MRNFSDDALPQDQRGLADSAGRGAGGSRSHPITPAWIRSWPWLSILATGPSILPRPEQIERAEAEWERNADFGDQYTHLHSLRVAVYAVHLGQALELTARELFTLRMGGLLHDVGKLALSPEILLTRDRFTARQRAQMEAHPSLGCTILEGLPLPEGVLPLTRYHHERWAGGGYPEGIAGQQIPLLARILAITDVFDALASDRPYRAAYTPEESLRVMCKEMPGYFDPALLDLWCHTMSSGFDAAA